MAFDTFDEGVNFGGVRSKNEIRTLICYLFNSINKPMDKNTIVEAIQEKDLANYFEITACFEDLVKNNNIKPIDDNKDLFEITEQGKMVAEQLDFILATTVKEKAYTCAIELLRQKQIEKENKVTITEIEKGYNVNCRISGGDVDLLSIDIYVPDKNQGKIIKKNFHKDPEAFYKMVIRQLTGDKDF